MADEKKISILTESTAASGLDEFVVVNKDVVVGQDAGATGQTSKITLDNLRNAILGGSSGSSGNDVVFDANVGIGTLANPPQTKLEIYGDRDAIIRLTNQRTNEGGDEFIGGLEFYSKDFEGGGNHPGAGVRSSITSKTRMADGSGGDLTFSTASETDNNLPRMTIDKDGNVGIGTASPMSKLDIKTGGTNAGQGITFSYSDAAASHHTIGIGHANYGNQSASNYMAFSVWDSRGASWEDGTDANGTANGLTERMRIDGVGNVGIGTSNPDGPLHIRSTSGRQISLTRKSDIRNSTNGAAAKIEGGALIESTATHGAAIGLVLQDSQTGQQNPGPSSIQGYMYFETKDTGGSLTEKMRIKHNGNVGIGDDNPNVKLSVKGDNADIYLRDGSGVTSAVIGQSADGHGKITVANDVGNAIVTLSSDGGDSFIKNGNVGIGTSSPGHLLNVSDGTVNFKINPITDHATAGTEAQIGTVTNHDLTIQTNNTTRMTFRTSGNVGIGTVSPTAKLEIRHDDPVQRHGYHLTISNRTSANGVTPATYTNIMYVRNPNNSSTPAACVDLYYGANRGIQLDPRFGGGGNYSFFKCNMGIGNRDWMAIVPSHTLTVDGTIGAQGGVSILGMGANDLDNIRAFEASGLDNINNLVVSEFEKDGVTKVGIVAQDMQKVLPQSVSGGDEYEAVAVEAEGRVVKGLGTDDEHEYCPSLKKSDFENPEHTWDEGAEFIETKAEETETRNHSLATSNDELIATLVKAVQELSAKVDELSK